MEDLKCDRCLLKQSLSEFQYYCPVTWKNERVLVKCNNNYESCVLYKNQFYYFRSNRERDMFLSNPNRFLLNMNFPIRDDMPLRIPADKAAQSINHEKFISGHCPVTIMDEERVAKGD